MPGRHAALLAFGLIAAAIGLVYLVASSPCPVHCDGNVRAVTLSYLHFYGGSTASPIQAAVNSSLVIWLNNPESATYITSLQLTSYGSVSTSTNETNSGTSSVSRTISTMTPITSWDDTSDSGPASATINFAVSGKANGLNANSVSSFTFYPWSSTSQNFTQGQTFNYVINLANGELVSGSGIVE